MSFPLIRNKSKKKNLSLSLNRNGNNKLDWCRLEYTKMDFSLDIKDSVQIFLKENSKFCKNKNIGDISYLSKGSFGKVFKIKINNKDYAIKVQFTKGIKYEELEDEVYFSYICEGANRKSDGKQIGIRIYDCFFICNSKSPGCSGFFIFIMDYGQFSGNIFLKNVKKIGYVQNYINQMLENIKLSITERKLYCTDHKPHNSIIMEHKENGKKIHDAKIIDFSPKFCGRSYEDFIDSDKLNEILRKTKSKDSKNYILNKNGRLSHNKLNEIFYTIVQLQFINQCMVLLRLNPVLKKKSKFYPIFFNNNEINIARNIFDKLFSVNAKEWLSVSISILLGTIRADGIKKYGLKYDFYHYYGLDPKEIKPKDFMSIYKKIVFDNFKNIYKKYLIKDGKEDIISKIDYIYKKPNLLSLRKIKNKIKKITKRERNLYTNISYNQHFSKKSSNH